MIKLKNVSKFYYSKGVIASGFSKVNLNFDIGEFVAITGESGSGKSTLLNVISGLDTYEEGEMYINGEETSHYSEKDFEDYRRKYIGNIFQNFNLVNSYTVYQNIELVLLLNGNKKKDIKEKVIELIKQVNLYKFRNTKVSKLSGGQKQRVAIARALAKDTPIIIADEPTGNLDSKSAKSIIKLLSEIATNKLVIIVTHNYEQVEDYVTRKITMHDGKVLEDKKVKETKKIENTEIVDYKNITFLNKLRLGIRNAFNIIPKFLLIFFVYLFITVALISEYATFKKQEYLVDKSGYNYYFQETSDKRIVIKKNDKSAFTDEDYKNIEELDNIDYVIQNDLLLDSYINITDDDNFWISGNVANISNLTGSLDLGRMPENDNEIVIVGNKNDYYIGHQGENLLNKDLYLQDMYTGNINKDFILKIVGIKYLDSDDYRMSIYGSDELENKLKFQINQNYSKLKILFRDGYYDSNHYDNHFRVIPNNNVEIGDVYISSDLNSNCKNQNCLYEPLKIEIQNLYYEDVKDLIVTRIYTKKNMKSILGLDDYDNLNGAIFISVDDYNQLFNRATYQSSVFVKDVEKIDETIKALNDMNIETLKIKDTLINEGMAQAIQIMRTIVTIVLVITLFFISYFVIRIILKSRNVYFSTLRMLGATKQVSSKLLMIELLTVSNLAYFLFVGFIYISKIKGIDIEFIMTILTYLKLSDYIILYIVLTLISMLISIKFSKNLFKNSAVKTMKEEV